VELCTGDLGFSARKTYDLKFIAVVKSPAAQIVAIFKRGVVALKRQGKKALNLSIRSMVLVWR